MCERPAPPPKTALELFSRLLVLRRAAGLWSAPCGGVWLWAGDEWLLRFYRTLYLRKMNLRHSQTALGCLIVKPFPDVSKWDQPCQHLDWKCLSVLKNAEILKGPLEGKASIACETSWCLHQHHFHIGKGDLCDILKLSANLCNSNFQAASSLALFRCHISLS